MTDAPTTPESTQTVNAAGIRCSAWLGRVRELEIIIEAKTAELEAAKGEKREIEREMEKAAPYECSCCQRGLWDKNKPHLHTNVFSRKHPQTTYAAAVVERPNGEVRDPAK